jgi:sulfur carrier protein
MKINYNGKEIETHCDTLDALLKHLDPSPPFAIAVNGAFLPAHLREQTFLNAGDRIELLSPIQGG